jgi:hypothetical protein
MGIFWPNYDDNTMYWQCTEVNQPPTARSCELTDYWFSFYHQGCVHQDVWIGHPPMPSTTAIDTTTSTMTDPGITTTTSPSETTTIGIPTAPTPIPTIPTAPTPPVTTTTVEPTTD